jgi:AraC-like DNA-binding protein
MNYTEYQPSSTLKEIIKNYWQFVVPDDTQSNLPIYHETLPHSEMSIVFIEQPNFKGIRILGPHTKKFEKTIFPDSFYFGVRILPWVSFTPSLVDKHQVLNLTAECPEEIAQYFESIKFNKATEPSELILSIEECFTKLVMEAFRASQNDFVKYICLELSSGQSVGATIDSLPISTRVIQKKFKEVVGMSMNRYRTISRQSRLWTDVVKNQKAEIDVLYKYGFFDQAHFMNDFKKHMNQPYGDFGKRLKKIDISLT